MNRFKQGSGWMKTLVILITVLAMYHIAVMLFESARPEYYYEYTGVRSLMHAFTFPYLAVSLSIGLLVTEAIWLVFVLTRQFGSLWLRGLRWLIVFLPFLLVWILVAM